MENILVAKAQQSRLILKGINILQRIISEGIAGMMVI